MSSRNEEIALTYYRNNQDDIITGKILGITPSTVRRKLREFRAQTKEEPAPAKILLIDIEVSQILIKTWGIYKQQPQSHRIVLPWFIICYQAKWLYDSEFLGQCVTSGEAVARDDTRVLKGIYDLLNEADIVIGHNVQRFDLRKINSLSYSHFA